MQRPPSGPPAAWYWHRKKTHSELAKAIVIVLAALVAIGEVIQIASQFRSESKPTVASVPNLFDQGFASQPHGTEPSQAVTTSGASAASHVAEIEKQAVALFNQKRYKEARPLFDQACNGTDENGFKYAGFDGDMKACNYLGYLYAKGLGGTRDRGRRGTSTREPVIRDLVQLRQPRLALPGRGEQR